MPVSDERAKEIWERTVKTKRGQAAQEFNDIKELIADREESKRDKEAVIAKIKEEINDLDNHCCQGALFAILDHIRNPKVADGEVPPKGCSQPTADSKEEKK